MTINKLLRIQFDVLGPWTEHNNPGKFMGKTRFITAGSFIDGSGEKMHRNVFLAVKDSIITAIGPMENLPDHNDTEIDDFSHCTIVPALVDCSVFLSHSPSVDSRVRSSTEQADVGTKTVMLGRHIRYCHAHGVLGVAASDDLAALAPYKDDLKQESLIDIRKSIGISCNRKNCASDNTTGGDFLKINYSGNIDDKETSIPRLDYQNLYRTLQQKGNRKAVVVANGLQQVKDALKAGCDAIEQGYAMGEENLRKIVAKKVLWIPSVVRARNGLDGSSSGGDICCRFSQRYVAPGNYDPEAEAFWKKMLARQLAQLRLAKELGVTTALGTGAGSIGILHGEAIIEEMKLFIKAGYSLTETIRCASKTGAGFFDMGNLGPLTVGRKATFLITKGTPQQLPRKLSYLEGIYVNGMPSNAYSKIPVKTV